MTGCTFERFCGFIYLVLTVIYGAFWVGLAILFSVLFRSVATSLLFLLALWIFFGFGVLIIALAIPEAIPLVLLQFSPNWLFAQASAALLQPGGERRMFQVSDFGSRRIADTTASGSMRDGIRRLNPATEPETWNLKPETPAPPEPEIHTALGTPGQGENRARKRRSPRICPLLP